MTYLIFLMEFF